VPLPLPPRSFKGQSREIFGLWLLDQENNVNNVDNGGELSFHLPYAVNATVPEFRSLVDKTKSKYHKSFF
jgi:hypothetical protein